MLIVGPIVELGNVARRVRGEIQIERLLVGSRRNELSRNHRNLTRSIRIPRVETSYRDWRVRQRATPNQTLDEAAGALHPQALQIGMTIANGGGAAGACRGKDARAESRAKNAAVAHRPAMGDGDRSWRS